MANFSKGTKLYQEKTGFQYLGQGGNLVYMDATNGSDGNNGSSPREAVLTLAQLVSLLSAGDTGVVIGNGGSETVSATVTIATANVKIVCPAGLSNPKSGYAISGAGTLNLITLGAADVVLEGIQFKHTGATANASGVLVGATSHRAVVRKCVFDDTAIVTTKTGDGVQITAGANDVCVEDCLGLDIKYDVHVKESTTNESSNLMVKNCTFHVGLAAGFGVYAPQASGKLLSPKILGCLFLEANGDGGAATAAWDGTDDTNATQGPVYFGAAVDQYLISGCRAYTALGQAFNTLSHITSGSTGDTVDCATGTGSDTSAAVTSVGVQVSQALSMATKASTGASTAASYASAANVSSSTAASSAVLASTGASTAASVATLGSTGASTAASIATLASTGASTAASSAVVANSSAVSYATAATLYHSSSLSMATKASTGASTAASMATLASTGASSAASVATLASTGASTAGSIATLASTSASSALSAAQSVGTVATAVGKPISKVGSMADNAIDNNTQSAGCLMATAAGDVWIEQVLIAKDSTLLAGPTNVEVSSDNAYGLTGVNKPHAVEAITALQANENIACTGASGTPLVPFILEAGKKLYLHGDNAAGSSVGVTKYAVIGRALSVGGSLS